MITELQIGGFKSFGTPAQTLALGPLNFVVGANASGKTNLISALRFLQIAVLQNIEQAADEFGGTAEIRNKILLDKESEEPVSIGLKLDWSGNEISRGPNTQNFRILTFNYLIKLDFPNSNGQIEVASEDLIVEIESNKGEKLDDYRLIRDKEKLKISDPTLDITKRTQEFKISAQDTKNLALGVVGFFFSHPSMVLRNFISNWHFYNIEPMLTRTPFKETAYNSLGIAGQGLGVMLHKIEQQDKDALDSIIAGIRSIVPGFKDLKIIQLPIEGKWAFQVLEENIRGAINPDSVSDGTIRLLALMVIAYWTAKYASLIVIEEPEKSVHPHLSESIVNLLRFASQNCQLIITTHNPDFLDHLEPKEVIPCEKIEGFTKFHYAADVEQIDIFRKHFSLGELWVQGTLGGIP